MRTRLAKIAACAAILFTALIPSAAMADWTGAESEGSEWGCEDTSPVTYPGIPEGREPEPFWICPECGELTIPPAILDDPEVLEGLLIPIDDPAPVDDGSGADG